MDASRFIAGRLRFKGKIAMISIAISSFVMIIAVSISAGYRKEIRRGVSSVSGDVQLTSFTKNYISEDDPIEDTLSYMDKLLKIKGIEDLQPAIYRAGIVKQGDDIHGVIFKGTPSYSDTTQLGVSIPHRLADILDLEEGSDLLAYFVSDRVKVRKFKISSVYESVLTTDDHMLVYASIDDMRRLNGWGEHEVSALEITLSDEFKRPSLIEQKTSEIGSLVSAFETDDDSSLITTSVVENYHQLFDWLNLIDSNVLLILILMTIVAGFNMISGLLILLFRNISTIGVLKSMGMTDKAIGKVFLRVSSNLVLKGMAVGNALALLFCLVQGTSHIIHLNPENYFVSFVPVAVDIPMIIIADVAAYAAIMLLLLIPSLFISRIDPAQTVRSA